MATLPPRRSRSQPTPDDAAPPTVKRSASAPATLESLADSLAALDMAVQRLAARSHCPELVAVAKQHSTTSETDDFLPAEKPMASIRRTRHDPASRRGNLHGRTGRRLNMRAYLDHFDQDALVGGDATYLSALETEIPHLGSLNKGGAWDAVPALLEEHSIVTPQVSRGTQSKRGTRSDGAVVTEYQLEPVGMLVHNKEAQAEAADPRLFRLYGRRPRVWATPPTGPPDGFEALKLLKPARFGGRRAAREPPIVRTRGAAWSVEANGGLGAAQLDIDLGCSCRIDGFSTQGKVRASARPTSPSLGTLASQPAPAPRAVPQAPFTRQYPYTWRDHDTRRFHVEHRPHWDPLERYKGPFWTVVCLEEHELGPAGWGRRRGRQLEELLRLDYVRRYELFYRPEGCRQWVSLGLFNGNVDATSEVAHDLRHVKPAVVARHLRVVPLACEGGGALRVGVYGAPLVGAAARGGGGGAAAAAAAVQEEEEGPPPFISYRLTRPGEEGGGRERYNFHHARRFTYEGQGRLGGRWHGGKRVEAAQRRAQVRSNLSSGWSDGERGCYSMFPRR